MLTDTSDSARPKDLLVEEDALVKESSNPMVEAEPSQPLEQPPKPSPQPVVLVEPSPSPTGAGTGAVSAEATPCSLAVEENHTTAVEKPKGKKRSKQVFLNI